MNSPNSFLDKICSKGYYEHREKVRVGNLESLEKIIQQLVDNGPDNLQIISDFDYTLSKTHTNEGKKCFPAADIIRQSPLMPSEFKVRAKERYDALLPIELDSTLTIEQKIPAVIESFKDGFDDIVSSKVVNRTSLSKLIADADDSFQLRDNCDKTLKALQDRKVPMLIFSAGFGDLVQGILHKYSLDYPNIHVIANFMDFDEDGQLMGFKEPLIHTFNKNDSVIPSNCQYFHELAHRTNVILLGDSIGDASMAQGVHKPDNILKIGFLNEVSERQLEIFLEYFDIVLLDDQSMDFVNCLLNKILC